MSAQHDEVSCKRAFDLLFAYLEGELPDAEAAAVREHFSHCPPCEMFVEGYRKTSKLCRKALERDVPAEVTSRLRDFLRSKRGGR